MNTLLEVENLKVRRGGAAVLDIPRFHLAEGEFAALIGPNGSGKSTLLLSLMALLPRAAGRLVFRGRPVANARDALDYRRRIGLVFQEPLLFDTSVADNVAAGPRLRGLPRVEVQRRVAACLASFEVGHLSNRHARKLSSGEARRVSLARAFAAEPELILFDEPFVNLDPSTRQTLSQNLERVLRDSGVTALLVSHDQSEALRLASRIVALEAGQIVQEGSSLELMRRPANAFVARFLGFETLLEAEVAGRDGQMLQLAASGRTLRARGDAPAGARVLCGIRPENVRLGREDGGAANSLPGTVREVSALGPWFSVTLDCGFPLVSYVTREVFAALALRPGQELHAGFEPGAVHLIGPVS